MLVPPIRSRRFFVVILTLTDVHRITFDFEASLFVQGFAIPKSEEVADVANGKHRHLPIGHRDKPPDEFPFGIGPDHDGLFAVQLSGPLLLAEMNVNVPVNNRLGERIAVGNIGVARVFAFQRPQVFAGDFWFWNQVTAWTTFATFH